MPLSDEQRNEIADRYIKRRAVALRELAEGLARRFGCSTDEVWGVVEWTEHWQDARRYRGQVKGSSPRINTDESDTSNAQGAGGGDYGRPDIEV